MADNEERRGQPGGEGADRGEELDRTAAFDPFADDGAEGGAAAAPGLGDAAPRPGSNADETARFAAGGAVPLDRTAQMPPAAAAPGPGGPPAWSGRASVPPAGPPIRESVPAEWGPGEEPPGRTWWLPIIVGLVALLLLAVLGYGVWLIASSRDSPAPVAPSPSPSAGTAEAPTSAAPTTVSPTAQSPSPSPTMPESVEVPPVVGLPQPLAEALLEQAGLRSRVEHRNSNRPAGTVLRSNPDPGEKVAPGSEVTLIVAESRKEPATSAPAAQTPNPTSTG